MNQVYLFNSKVKINQPTLSALHYAGINNIDDLMNIIITKEQLKVMRNIWSNDIEKIWNYIKRHRKEGK